MKLQAIIETGDGELWGRIQSKDDFILTTVGQSVKEVLDNLKDLFQDYLEHEGKEHKYWKKAIGKEVELELHYDMQALFEEHNYLSISAIADRAGMNASLLRQYARGIKHPSAEQAKKIETALREVGKELVKIAVLAA